MEYKNASIMRDNTQIIETSFEKVGIHLIQFNWTDKYSNALHCIIEIATSNDEVLQKHYNVVIQGNVYDENGSILDHQEEYIWIEKFIGYDTIELTFVDVPKNSAQSARIYCTGN